MRVILVGAAGRMGAQMVEAIKNGGEELVAAADRQPLRLPCACYDSVRAVREAADVVVDFSHASGTGELLDFCLERRLPLVIATTGQSDADKERIASAAQQIPIFFCSNMSFGVALFASLVSKVAEAFKYADVEIVETHHASKADCPSGTANMLANEIIRARGVGRVVVGKRSCRKIGDVGISSLRMGERAGVHEVHFDTGFQMISLRHEAFGRELFARGAINAMRFLVGRPAGLYDVKSMMELK